MNRAYGARGTPIRLTSAHVVRSVKEKRKGQREYLKIIMTENATSLIKDMNINIQDAP